MNYAAILTFAVCSTLAILALAGVWMAVERALGVAPDESRSSPAE